MKTIIYFMVSLLLFITACSSENEMKPVLPPTPETPIEPEEPEMELYPISSLVGTKWRLEYFGNKETGELISPILPIHLHFQTNSILETTSNVSSAIYYLDTINWTMDLTYDTILMIYLLPEIVRYSDALFGLNLPYELTEDKLIIHSNKTDFLQYIPFID